MDLVNSEKDTDIERQISLEQLQRRVPILGDKALLDLVNGIQVNKEMIRYRKNRNFLGQILDNLTGHGQKRQILLDGNLIAGQEALHQWLLELTDSLRISQIGIQITQQSLLETRQAVRSLKANLQKQSQDINDIFDNLSKLQGILNTKFKDIDKRIHQLEIRLSANEDLDRILTAWLAGQSYNKLPWPIQVAFLAKEVFSSAVINYEMETGDTDKFRTLLAYKLLAHFKDLPKNFFNQSDLLDLSYQQMSSQDLLLTYSLLEVHSISPSYLYNSPLLFSLGKTLELATIPEADRPKSPGRIALTLCRNQIGLISHTTDAEEFIHTIIGETANHCLTVMSSKTA
ncbi:hypothetical protein IQ219_12220 [Synechocystis sp. LEGE 06083]|uniref:diguanylate cyclase regulator RdcB family protein n=1 Tax=Synechocystis sp. LEGE 06083 TaxID=915336 RepID=UPI00187F1E47|nr:diguanylate cyclase regulator RdcB family protein [Synechocystis sp. LEGE 06083]MBE9196054.1 hypothetical protein [Synechocystis sp. LEGE 06083]